MQLRSMTPDQAAAYILVHAFLGGRVIVQDDALLPFSVLFWGSHPDEGNDDCHSGDDFSTIEEARAAYDDWQTTAGSDAAYTTHVQIDGPEVHEIKQVVSDEELTRRKQAREQEAKREAAMPATQPTRTFVAIDLCDRLLFAADCLRHDGLVDAADLAALLVEAVDRLRHLSPMTPAVPADMSGSVVVGEDGEPEQFAITFADYVAERRTQKGGK